MERAMAAADVTADDERRHGNLLPIEQTPELLHAIVEDITDAVFVKDRQGRYLFCNKAAARFMGRPVEAILGHDDATFFDRASVEQIQANDRRVLEEGSTLTSEEQLTAAGVTRTYLATKTPYRDRGGQIIGVIGSSRDITGRTKAQLFLRRQNSVLEQIATKAPLSEILDQICVMIEEQLPGTFCSILLLDRNGVHLRVAAARSLPAAYNAAVDGVAIGPAVGSCGTAAFRREAVIVTDIATDSLWAGYTELALSHGLRACWSIPIFDRVSGHKEGAVLGTFAVYASQPAAPTAQQLEWISRAEYLACVAIGTERSAHELRDSEHRFRTFVDHATDAFFLHDETGTVLDVNQQACDSLGYTREELIGLHPRAFDTQISAEEFRVLLERLASRESVSFDSVLRRKDGSQFPVEIRLRPFLLDGQPRAIGLVHDITGRKHAEEELRSSRQMLQLVLHSLPGGVFWKDRESKYLGCNRVSAEAFGTTPETCAGKTDAELLGLTSEQAAFFVQTDREIVQSGQPRFGIVEQATFADGSVHWLETNKIPLTDANRRVIGVLGTWQDITDRKRAEDQLRESQRLIETIAHASPLTIYVFNVRDRRVTYTNRRTSEELGYSDKDVDQLGAEYLTRLLHPDDYARLPEWLARWETATDGQVFETEYRLRHADGSWHWFIGRDTVFTRSPAGRVEQVIGTTQDVTDRKRLEEQFLHAQKMEALGRLAGGVAHDFNNLLTVINGYCELLSDQTTLSDGQQEMVAAIRDAGQRAARLTRQLLAFSHRAMVEPKVLDLNELVRGSESLFQRLIGEHIRLQIKLDERPGYFQGDAGQLEQVLMNLVVNARDAMPDGGKLTIRTSRVQVSEKSATASASGEDHVQLEVTDTGCGMSPEVMSRIYEPFFTTKGHGKGTGLGLPVVHGVVQQSGGTIEVRSTPAQGTSFLIRFPAVSTAPQEPVEQAPSRSLKRTATLLLRTMPPSSPCPNAP